MYHLIFSTSARYASVGTATLPIPFALLPIPFALLPCRFRLRCYFVDFVNTVADLPACLLLPAAAACHPPHASCTIF
ncbi:hypothetical protein [Methanimicrococcus hacksteinii]|uniref:hypothetical protein n=1 Tax=Methanimicrococcus hacksteinii TaxID=3028293 RepID=UPI00298EE986|nr:hypothetical protein [Methanimicrococcus sp. At1]